MKLSIAIPVYQVDDLKMTLKSLLPQVISGIEIVIVDNSVDDKINNYIYSLNSSVIKYYHEPAGLGVDQYILKCIEYSLGEYVWILGDDELAEGIVKMVLNVITKYEYITFLFVNFRVVGEKDRDGAERFFKDKNEILNILSNRLGFVSSSVFKKSSLAFINKEKVQEFTGSRYLNLYLMLHVICDKGKKYLIERPYVICHPTPEGERNYDGFQAFGVTFYKIMMSFKNEFNKKSLRKILARNFNYLWRGELVGYVKGETKRVGKLRTMMRYYWDFPEIILVIPLFLLPRPILRIFYRLYKLLGLQILKNVNA